jgi:hypothetical protein
MYILHAGETEKLMVSINKALPHVIETTRKTNYCTSMRDGNIEGYRIKYLPNEHSIMG